MSERLSIAMLSHVASPAAPTGAEHSLALLARGLQARGHRVRVAVPGRFAAADGLRRDGVELVRSGSRPLWLVYHDPRPWPSAVARWLRYALPDPGRGRLRRWLRSCAPDVVHVNCLPHLGGAAAATAAGLPVLWHVREILPPGARRRFWARRLARHARAIVAVSEAVAAWIREEGLGDRVAVVPNGADPPSGESADPASARAALDLPDDGSTWFGLLGQIVPHKGVPAFVDAAERAARTRPESLRFLIAGAGPPEHLRQVRQAIERSHARERFHLLPPRPRGGMLIAACDVVCLTTLTPDPLPRSVLEAMASGRPVAAFASGGVPEMVVPGETGLLVPTGDVEALAVALERLASDPTLRATMGRAAAARARNEFSLATHVERMESALRRTAQRGQVLA